MIVIADAATVLLIGNKMNTLSPSHQAIISNKEAKVRTIRFVKDQQKQTVFSCQKPIWERAEKCS